MLDRASFALAVSLIGVAGCAHKAEAPSFAEPGITYNLPTTAIKLTAEFSLLECSNDMLVVEPTVTLLPVALPSADPQHHLAITGTSLQSFTNRRDLEIKLHPHGAIKSINTTVADETPAIIGNVIKVAGTFLGFTEDLAPSGTCNKETLDALRLAEVLETSILAERDDIASGTSADEDARTRVDLMAAELARIKRDQLTIKLNKIIVPSLPTPATNEVSIVPQYLRVSWDASSVDRWSDGNLDPSASLALGVCIIDKAPADGTPTTCNERSIGSNKLESLEFPDLACGSCEDTLVFRQPRAAEIKVIALSSSNFRRQSWAVEAIDNKDADGNIISTTFSSKPVTNALKTGNVLARAPVSISQWGELTYFPLQARFGGNNTLSMALNEFGAPTTYGWKSNASGSAVSSFGATTLESVTGIVDAEAAESLAEQKAEIDELETQQKLNRLLECQSIIENGGYDCTGDSSS